MASGYEKRDCGVDPNKGWDTDRLRRWWHRLIDVVLFVAGYAVACVRSRELRQGLALSARARALPILGALMAVLIAAPATAEGLRIASWNIEHLAAANGVRCASREWTCS